MPHRVSSSRKKTARIVESGSCNLFSESTNSRSNKGVVGTTKSVNLHSYRCVLLGMQRASHRRGLVKSEEGAFFANAGRSADEPIRAANACICWGVSAPIRANRAFLGRPLSIAACGGEPEPNIMHRSGDGGPPPRPPSNTKPQPSALPQSSHVPGTHCGKDGEKERYG